MDSDYPFGIFKLFFHYILVHVYHDNLSILYLYLPYFCLDSNSFKLLKKWHSPDIKKIHAMSENWNQDIPSRLILTESFTETDVM
jgi:transposase